MSENLWFLTFQRGAEMDHPTKWVRVVKQPLHQSQTTNSEIINQNLLFQRNTNIR